MINVDFTKMSSKGQIVIPQEMRKGLDVGDRFIIIRRDNEIILKPAEDLEENFLEDLNFAKKTLASLDKCGKGKFKEMEGKDFLKELEKW
jgi:AbrB family looped-hinge helix DNA binding protein